jgi:hypothetical protein
VRWVLWVAQTDELCEQAVQSFRQVWSNCGQDWTELRIVRMWGGNPDPTPSAYDAPTAVVANIQTLTSRLGRDRLGLVKACALVVIDESHHAITPSYTRLLDSFVPEEPTEDTEEMPPVIGLTATPFRGKSEEETRWLANRFARRMLPSVERQCSMTNFAMMASSRRPTPRHFTTTLRSHSPKESWNILDDSTSSRKARCSGSPPIPIAMRLSSIACENAVADGPVLLFSNSVQHAQHLTARLCLSNVPAASIYADTDVAVRQFFIRQFLEGHIKVLANYQVLATGFDAPKTSYAARGTAARRLARSSPSSTISSNTRTSSRITISRNSILDPTHSGSADRLAGIIATAYPVPPPSFPRRT